jgi:murein DD-endopeptidase MepM/ murein hydrolase activator NlpD
LGAVAAAGVLTVAVVAAGPPGAFANEPVQQPRTAHSAAPGTGPGAHPVVVSRGFGRAGRTDVGDRVSGDRVAGDRLAGFREGRAHAVAEAATWRVDPALLRPQPTDSVGTATARAQLAVLAGQLRQRVAAYDSAHERAASAAASARRARRQLSGAQHALAEARARYEADRALLVNVLTEDYTRTQLAPLAALLTSDDDGSLPGDLTMLGEMGRIQDGAVQRAERSRTRLEAAEQAYEVAAGQAASDLRAARAAATEAMQARDDVLGEFQQAKRLVTDSELADVAAREETSSGYRGRITFPLPPGTPFVDQDNFGGRSSHWATVHTGDDFSTACGSPVVAANDGTVMIRTDQRWSGRWLVMVSTAEGSLTTWYAHMQALDVTDGQHVRAGDPIGEVGQEGNATGCHLHFEVHPTGGGIYEDDTDPETWLHRVGAYPSDS